MSFISVSWSEKPRLSKREKKQWVNDDDVTLPKYKISMFIILYFQKLPAFSNGEEEVSYIQLISSPIYL